MNCQKYRINGKRMIKNLFEFAEIGRNRLTGGINRAFGSEADREARRWLLRYWEGKLHLCVRIDAIGNIWARKEGEKDLAPIVFGSHHDAVPEGGMYDGAAGVMAATEIMQTVIEQGIVTRHPFEIVSFTGEEPNLFNVSTLGSKVLSGRLRRADLDQMVNRIDGSAIREAVEAVGGDYSQIDHILIHPGEVAAFLEYHIEQGRRLADMELPTAAVKCITGIYREDICISGETNHAGTTDMKRRKDAFSAAAEFALLYEAALREQADKAVGTVTGLELSPDAVGIIPGIAKLKLELRTADSGVRKIMIEKISHIEKKIAASRGVQINRVLNLDQLEMPMDPQIMNTVIACMESRESPVFVSMAGHDAANMQRVARSGLIFTQSANGMSHCPQEYSRKETLEETANVMFRALLQLDCEL